MFYVYILKSINRDNQLYVGYTENVEVRFDQHNKGLVQSTRPYLPWELIFYEAYKSQKDTKRREKYFKTTKGRRALKLMLIDTLKLS